MDKKRMKTAAPHIRGGMNTARIMQCVILALLPMAVSSIFYFGTQAFLLLLICVVSCVLTEFTVEAFLDLPLTMGDGSAVVTGLIYALLLPAKTPLWLAALGGIFAIAVVKLAFRGEREIPLNPAAAAYVLISMILKFYLKMELDAPVGYPGLEGNIEGALGETSLLALTVGVVFLTAMGILRLRISLCTLLGFVATWVLFGGQGWEEVSLTGQLCSGSFMLGLWFMVNDYRTSPITRKGQCLYGLIFGVLSAAFRIMGGGEFSICLALLLANLCAPLLEKWTFPKAFGCRGL